MPRLGLVVNPIAGLGGRVGLKGTDGAATAARALAAGARPEAGAKAERALHRLSRVPGLVVVAPGGPMGAAHVVPGLQVEVADVEVQEVTSAEHTILAARAIVPSVDLLAFVGGDGTARDILTAVGTDSVVIGVPAGVRIQSAVFGATPEAAGELGARFLTDRRGVRVTQAEVLDGGETSHGDERPTTRLYGYLNVPSERRLLQRGKAGTDAADDAAAASIAAEVVASMDPDTTYVFGPGSTTKAVFDLLGLPKTLLGVDIIRRGALLAADANEQDLMTLVGTGPVTVVVSVIGGQGFVLGRGNQQISPAVLRSIPPGSLWILATDRKLAALGDQTLLIDTGDVTVDRRFEGFVQVIVGVSRRASRRLAVP